MNCLVLLCLFIGTYSSLNEAMLPSMPSYQALSPLIALLAVNQTENTPPPLTVSSNHTIQINTTNMNPECTPECYLNCQVHFTELLEEKYCIINVCKCEVINEGTTIVHNNLNQPLTTQTPTAKFLMLIKTEIANRAQGIKDKLWSESFNYIIFIFFVYELWVIGYFFNDHSSKNSSDLEDSHLYQKLISEEKEEID